MTRPCQDCTEPLCTAHHCYFDVDMPWCEACQSYHAKTAPGCFARPMQREAGPIVTIVALGLFIAMICVWVAVAS